MQIGACDAFEIVSARGVGYKAVINKGIYL